MNSKIAKTTIRLAPAIQNIDGIWIAVVKVVFSLSKRNIMPVPLERERERMVVTTYRVYVSSTEHSKLEVDNLERKLRI